MKILESPDSGKPGRCFWGGFYIKKRRLSIRISFSAERGPAPRIHLTLGAALHYMEILKSGPEDMGGGGQFPSLLIFRRSFAEQTWNTKSMP